MEQAIEILASYFTEKGYLRQRQILRDAESGNRIVNLTGDDALEGVSVTFAMVRRAQLVVEEMGAVEGPYVRAEGGVEAITLATPSAGGTWPEPLGGVIPGAAPLHYATLSAGEVKLLPGADVFLPAFMDAMVQKAKEALTPPPPPPPLEPPA
jgi:hypothetical protein